MNDDKKLYDRIENIRKKYKSKLVDPNEVKLSFIDELNELIKGIFHDDPTTIYNALKPEELEKWKRKRIRRGFARFFKNFKPVTAFYWILLCAIIGFLVSEALPFYAVGAVIGAKTYVKAILTETCFVFLSGYRAVGKLQTSLVAILRVCIFCLMVFVISSDVTMRGVSAISEIDKIQEKIEFINAQIKSKDEVIEFYKEKGWGVNVRKQLDEKDKLVAELMELKNRQIDGKTADVSDQILYQTWGKAAFRIILLLISVLLTRRLFKF